MTNIEIDRKLAEAIGYGIRDDGTGLLEIKTDSWLEWLPWSPTVKMDDAWKVAERFGLSCLNHNDEDDSYTAIFLIDNEYLIGHDESATIAICRAALRVIEGSKSDEYKNSLYR